MAYEADLFDTILWHIEHYKYIELNSPAGWCDQAWTDKRYSMTSQLNHY